MLDTYFKQFFWTFHLLVLAACGFLVARAANVFVAAELGVPAAAIARDSKGGGKKANDTNKSTVPTQAFLSRNIFGAEIEGRPEEEDVAAEEAADESSDGPVNPDNCNTESAMRATLVGTTVSTDPEGSVASFQDDSKKDAVSYRIGEKLLDEAKIIAIEWRKVKVQRNGRCEYFSIAEEAKKKKGTASVPPLPAPPKKDDGKPDKVALGEGVKKTGANAYEIPQGEIDKVLSNLSLVATQARIVPSFKNGKPNGFKLFSIRPGSLYSKIGIMNGDIVQSINGYEMTSPDKAFEIYSKLKDASAITVDLVRRGKPKSITYNIR